MSDGTLQTLDVTMLDDVGNLNVNGVKNSGTQN